MNGQPLGDTHRSVRTDSPGPSPDLVYPMVAELLELPELADIKQLTRVTVAGLQRIRSTSVQEVPLEEFVRPGELVMTTGIGLNDDPARLTAFVREIAAAGAIALAIAVGPHVSKISSVVVREAERLGLILFEFPWERRFSEVTELVLNHIVERQQAWMQRSETVHDLFTRIVLSGGDLSQICRFLELQIERPVRIVDRWGEVTEAGEGSLTAADPHGWDVRGASVPISAEQKDLGMILVLAGENGLSGPDAMVAHHAATAAALIMLMQRAKAEGEARGQSELLLAVLKEASGSPRELERRAIALGFDPRVPFAVIHVQIGATPGDENDGEELTEVARWAVQRALAGRRTSALQAWDGSAVTLMLPDGAGWGAPRVNGLLDDITAYVRRQDPSISVSCGIGRVAPSLAGVPESFREALSACQLGVALHGSGSTTSYSALGAYPALHEALNADGSASALQDLQERYLGVADRYEAETGLPLLETLTAFFEERGNVSATARALRINRQSLLYRLERFQVLSEVDLSSPVDRFALELALRCWRMRPRSL